MKKLIIIAASLLLSVCAFAQISVAFKSETVAKFQGNNYTLKASLSGADTTYYMALNSNNQFHGRIIVDLGYREQAIAILQSMLDYSDYSSGNIVNLNNPSNNTAILRRELGIETYHIFEEHGDGSIFCFLGKVMIKKFLPALKEYGK